MSGVPHEGGNRFGPEQVCFCKPYSVCRHHAWDTVGIPQALWNECCCQGQAVIFTGEETEAQRARGLRQMTHGSPPALPSHDGHHGHCVWSWRCGSGVRPDLPNSPALLTSLCTRFIPRASSLPTPSFFISVFLLPLQLAEHGAWGGWRRQAQKVTATILGVKKIN